MNNDIDSHLESDYEDRTHFDDTETGVVEPLEDDPRYYPGEDMDGDFDSGMASAGMGTDEDYEHNLIDDDGEYECDDGERW